MQCIPKKNILVFASERGGVWLNQEDFEGENVVRSREKLLIQCTFGHKWTTSLKDFKKWCIVCEYIGQATQNKYVGSPYECITTGPPYLITSITYRCDFGHLFTHNSSRKGCPVCKLLREFAHLGCFFIADTYCVYRNSKSRMRLRCVKIKYGEQCGLEFYVSSQIKKPAIVSCKTGHQSDSAPIISMRIFETLFDRRFDDMRRDVIVTGYNKAAGIAFHHSQDTPLKDDQLNSLRSSKKVLFVEIKHATLRDQLNYITTTLYKNGKIKDPPCFIANLLYSKLKFGETANEMFSSRCIFDRSIPVQPKKLTYYGIGTARALRLNFGSEPNKFMFYCGTKFIDTSLVECITMRKGPQISIKKIN